MWTQIWAELHPLHLVSEMASYTVLVASFVRRVLRYGIESWPITGRVLAILTSCDSRMLRYMAGVSWQDRLSNAEVADRCGVDLLEHVVRRRRLRQCGHVKRIHESDRLNKVTNLDVSGRRPPCRSRKLWRRTGGEDMREVGAPEEDAWDRTRWRGIIKTTTQN